MEPSMAPSMQSRPPVTPSQLWGEQPMQPLKLPGKAQAAPQQKMLPPIDSTASLQQTPPQQAWQKESSQPSVPRQTTGMTEHPRIEQTQKDALPPYSIPQAHQAATQASPP